MSDDKKSSLKGLIRLILGGMLLGSIGVAMSVKGWNGFANGEINVYQKFGPSFVAYANGPHTAWFTYQVAIGIVGGGALSLLGFGVLAFMLFASPEKRIKATHAAANRSLLFKRDSKIPWWLATLVILGLLGLFLRAM